MASSVVPGVLFDHAVEPCLHAAGLPPHLAASLEACSLWRDGKGGWEEFGVP